MYYRSIFWRVGSRAETRYCQEMKRKGFCTKVTKGGEGHKEEGRGLFLFRAEGRVIGAGGWGMI
ncbi:MAG: hypothetical protein CMJ49_11110 [Planctomycetaceae bacterium]|nr:hypothetical protein [Planctomycetaceae bacterium]